MSAANAILDHMRDWFVGSEQVVSMAVIPPHGTYGIDTDLCFSLPVVCTGNWAYEIKTGIDFDEYSQGMFDATLQELKDEKVMGELE